MEQQLRRIKTILRSYISFDKKYKECPMQKLNAREVDGGGDFGEGGNTRESFEDTILGHREVSLLARELRDLVVGRVVAEEGRELVIHEDGFKEADAPFVTGVVRIRGVRFPPRFYFFRNQRFIGECFKYFCNHF